MSRKDNQKVGLHSGYVQGRPSFLSKSTDLQLSAVRSAKQLLMPAKMAAVQLTLTLSTAQSIGMV